MREDFLFDSDDKTQHGKGADRLGDKKDGVLLKWESKHHQIAFARIGNYTLKTIYWHTYYEAVVNYYGEKMESDQTEYKTKVDAQLGAEKLFESIISCGNKLLKEMKS